MPNAKFSGEERRRAIASRRSESAATYVWRAFGWVNFPTDIKKLLTLQILVKICNPFNNKAFIWQFFNRKSRQTKRLKMQIEIRWFCAKIFNSVCYLLCFLKISYFFRTHYYAISYTNILSYFCILFLDFVYFISMFAKIFLQQIFMYFGNFTISSCFVKFIFFIKSKLLLF